jgi:spermidine/putrescine transport system ATP-binding protein
MLARSPLPQDETVAALGAPLLSARGLVKRFGRQTVIDGVDLDVRERCFTTLLGPSGCGKTTILRMIGGFEEPDAGDLVLDGRSLRGVPPELRPVNTVFQSYALFPHLSVFENVAFALRLRQGQGDIDTLVRAALESVHMAGFEDRQPAQLSGGQQQRVAVARAVVARPQILLLDEPLSALDQQMRAHLQIELKDLQRRLGIAFVYVTHDQEEAFALSDEIVVMNKGRVLQRGSPQTIYRRPADAFVAGFIGGAALAPASVRAIVHGMAEVDTPFGSLTCPAADDLHLGHDAILVLRPEAIRIVEAADAIEGRVSNCLYQGGTFCLNVTVPGWQGAQVCLRVLSDRPWQSGGAIGLHLVPAKLFVTRGTVRP